MLQRFAQLVEQAGVLDRDDSLIGKILDQFDLLVGEQADLLAINSKDPDQTAFLEHRNAQKRSGSTDGRGGSVGRVSRTLQFQVFDQILDVDDLLCSDETAQCAHRANQRLPTP